MRFHTAGRPQGCQVGAIAIPISQVGSGGVKIIIIGSGNGRRDGVIIGKTSAAVREYIVFDQQISTGAGIEGTAIGRMGAGHMHAVKYQMLIVRAHYIDSIGCPDPPHVNKIVGNKSGLIDCTITPGQI